MKYYSELLKLSKANLTVFVLSRYVSLEDHSFAVSENDASHESKFKLEL